MATGQQVEDGSTSLKVRRGRVDSVDLYEIKDTELDVLEKGGPAETNLNFAVFAISTAITAFVALMTAEIKVLEVKVGFIVAVVVGVVLGLYWIVSWWKTRGEVKKLCDRIRQRIPPEVIITATTEEEEEEEEA